VVARIVACIRNDVTTVYAALLGDYQGKDALES
jgi:hypothetical protein